jgi:hypothetical protein
MIKIGIAKIASLRIQGATIKVKKVDKVAVHPMAALNTSSLALKLRKTDTEAIVKVIKENISIYVFLPH